MESKKPCLFEFQSHNTLHKLFLDPKENAIKDSWGCLCNIKFHGLQFDSRCVLHFRSQNSLPPKKKSIYYFFPFTTQLAHEVGAFVIMSE